jgi:L-2-hydroxyglutarate oxidase LhgO
LQKLQAQAVANGIFDLEMLEGAQAQRAEPALACVAALHSPSTGIVDAASLMLALLGDFEHAGGTLALHTVVVNGYATGAGIELVTQDGTRLLARHVINAAGLGAIPLARQLQGDAQSHVPSSYFAKGNYFSLTGRSPFGRLIYPVPQHAGLGVHLTLDLGGQARFGPDVQWVDSLDDLTVDPDRVRGFYASIRSYWPGLPDNSLVPAYAGIRPKISGPDSASADFCIQGPREHGVSGLVQLFGIESPGLTSSLAIGDYVRDLLNEADR